MGASEHLTITVPADLADDIRAHVTSGEYASENDIIVEALQLWRYDEGIEGDPDHEAWIRREVAPALDAYDRDRSRGMTIAQVRVALAEARDRRAAKA